MALTRKLLNALEIPADKVEQIIEAHTETVDALKNERDNWKAQAEQYKTDAEKLPDVQKELDQFKNSENGNGYKEKYEQEHAQFEQYKADIVAKETAAQKEKAYRKLLTDAGVSEGVIDLIIKGDPAEIELDDKGEVKDAEKLTNGIKTKYANFIVEERREGTQTHGGGGERDNNGGGQSRAAQIAAQYAKDRYGVDPSAKQ